MNWSVSGEFLALLINLAAGAVLGLIFDGYRLFYRFARPGWLFTQLSDLFFWVLSSLLVFALYFRLTGGEARVVTILAVPLGMLLYLELLSPRIQKPLSTFYLALARAFGYLWRMLVFLWHLLLLPPRLSWLVLVFLCQFLAGLVRLMLLPEKLLYKWGRRLVRESYRKWRHRPPHRPPENPPGKF